jgi:hypothetical protein
MKFSNVAHLVLGVGLATTVDPQFTDWSAPTNLGPPVNNTEPEFGPFLAKDGLDSYTLTAASQYRHLVLAASTFGSRSARV